LNKLLQHIKLSVRLPYTIDVLNDGLIYLSYCKNFSTFFQEVVSTFWKLFCIGSYTTPQPLVCAIFLALRPLSSTLKQYQWKKGYRYRSCDPDFLKLSGCRRFLYIKDLHTLLSDEKKMPANSVHNLKKYTLTVSF